MYDQEGFLTDITSWNVEIARDIATTENIPLTEEHWQIIHLAREYHSTFDISPEMRPFIKYLKDKELDQTISSIYLLKLFPGSPAKLISKIAGLPKPPNCI